MRFGLLLLLCTTAISFSLSAQDVPGKWECASLKHRMGAKTTTIDPAEENYDVKYVKFNLNVTNLNKYLSGDVTTMAKTTIASFSTYAFELDTALTIDSVLINGILRLFTTTGSLRTVSLAAPLTINTLFTAQVFYHGTPVNSASIFGAIGGYNNMTSPSWGTRVSFTQSESYHAKEWWPCKQSLRDKIDSVDMWLTVTNNLKAGSNGVLSNVATIDTGHKRYEWKERNPIDYYLISLAVAPYIDYSYYMHYTGSTDSTLVQNFIYNNPATLPAFKNVIDSTGMTIDYLSSLYGRYPFWQEKYGHCMAPLSGGMEHQTMTTIGFFEGSIVAHELGHQWFGDNVTCGTWADVTMNEGFASYTEDIFIDHFRSHTKMIEDIQAKQINVKSFDTGILYCADTSTEGRLFDSRLTYNKGACMLHMLRSVINNDSLFFSVYKTYQSTLKGSNGTIADFKGIATTLLGTTVNGINLDTFFNQWAYREGFPIYTIKWNQIGTDVYVKFDQNTAVPSSVPLFQLPVELTMHSPSGDTTVRVLNDLNTQTFYFNWSKAMNGLELDPNSWLVYKLTDLSRDPLFMVGVSQVVASEISIAPNPAVTAWHITSLQPGSTLKLTDINGRTIWQQENNTTTVEVPADNLAPGLYLLQVINVDGGSKVYKVVKG